MNKELDLSTWNNEDITKLQQARESINTIDTQLLELLNQRTAFSVAIGELKAKSNKDSAIFDPKREQELLAHLYKLNSQNNGNISNEHIFSIWNEIFSVSRALQKKLHIAYLGPVGTFSYYSGLNYFGEHAYYEPCANFQEVFEKIYDGSSDVGVVPLENSLHGTVGTCFDLFGKFDVNIQAEFYARIKLSLLSKEDSLLSVKKVYSHAQPLGQASIWLREHLPNAELISVDSTAAAAHIASNEPHSASIGHEKTSKTLGLNILANSIENDKKNWTRFVVITKNTTVHNALHDRLDEKTSNSINSKSSVLFTIKDKTGALVEILNCLANANINMEKLESRPLPNECWKYMFFADLSCDMHDKAQENVLLELNKLCASFKILGSYASGVHLPN